MSVPMNIMIPLGGLGTRFSREGYTRPKPFVRILGKEMILWIVENLEVGENDTVIIVYNPEFSSMLVLMKEVLLKHFPKIKTVELKGPTGGAAETVLFGLEGISATEREKPTMLVDGDTIYTYDVVGAYRKEAAKGNSGSFVFYDTKPQPIYSYCKVESEQSMIVTEIKEKVKISDWANSGCYCFSNGNILAKYCTQIISAGELQLSQDMKGEFYTSGVIAAMIRDGHKFVGLKIDVAKDVHVLGTPAQVKQFCTSIPKRISEKGLIRSYRFVFDLDNTLVTHPIVPGDYTSCKPIKRNIEYAQLLKKQGHYIIIATARRMRTHRGSVGRIIHDVGEITLNQIKQFDIPHDEIHFGKPWGHFYIDDLNVDPMTKEGSLAKQIGFYFPTSARFPSYAYDVDESLGLDKTKPSTVLTKKNAVSHYPIDVNVSEKLFIFAAGIIFGITLTTFKAT